MYKYALRTLMDRTFPAELDTCIVWQYVDIHWEFCDQYFHFTHFVALKMHNILVNGTYSLTCYVSYSKSSY